MTNSAVVRLLEELVAIGSVNPGAGPVAEPWQGERRIAEFAAAWLARAGIDVEVDEYEPGRANVVGRLQGEPGAPTLMLEAHLDTVNALWPDGDRFRPAVRGGRVFGLGACDDKAGVAAVMAACARIVDGPGPRCSVVLALTADEEHGFGGVKRLLENGVQADGAVVCEPTGLRIVVRHKALKRWLVRIRGRSAHASSPGLGDNAVYKAARVVTACDALAESLARRPASPLLGPPTLVVGTIAGGRQPNIVPDYCELTVDRRLLPEESPENVEREFRETVAGALPPGSDCDVETILTDPALSTDENAWIVKRAMEACAKTLGESVLAGASYGTDASKLSQAGIPSIVFGPGDISVVHAPGEFVEVDQLERSVEVFLSLMGRAEP